MTGHSSGPSGSRKSLQFAYDSQGRRYSKVVSNWTGSAWTRALHELYLYDSWNLLGALDGTNNAIVRSFLWGLDLSGSLLGAGGVGGLICFKQHSGSSAGSHFAAYDGNGNVMALVDGKTGSTSARYEYDPFGQTIRASGTMAMLNPVRFSSKCVDDETDLAYYGYRYFNPNSGVWLSRDPIGNAGGANYYAFVFNDSVSFFDLLGLKLVMNPVVSEPLAAIRGRPGQGTWFGDTTWSGPTAIGEGEFEERQDGRNLCAKIKRAKEIKVEVWTHVPSDAFGVVLTQRGVDDVSAHEGRRRTVIEKAFNAFIAPVELEGALATKCGWVCCCANGEAKKKLQTYINDLRGTAYHSFRTYVSAEQDAISEENGHWRPTVTDAQGQNLYDGYDPNFVHTVSDPGSFNGIKCPTCK